MKTKILVLGAVILFVLIWFAYDNYFRDSGNAIHIAFAGPLSGEGAVAGRLMSQAIQLYFDKINERGGINGKKLVLDRFDDQNNAKIAKQKAVEISEQNAVAVIGHWYSSASISAGKIYKEYQIPAITPGSVNIKVTKDNEWYFRNIYNAKDSGQFLANYVKYVFKQNKVSIIREQAAYGSYLAQVFEQECRQLGMEIQNQWDYNNDDPNLSNQFEQIVDKLEEKKEDAGVILLAVQATQAVELVKLIRDQYITNQVIGGSSLSEETFRNGFDNFPIEKNHPGFYTNDIHIATPLIFDTANENAQEFKEKYQTEYGEAPDWSAAYAYDTAMILVKALEKANIQATQSSIQSDRQQIRNTLANLTNAYDATEGVTGFNYFDKNRDAQKQPSIGMYKHKSLVSALTQFQAVRHTNEIADLEKAQREERVLFINDKYMYKTNVVYVGLSVIEISEIDIKNLQFSLDFKLWFRFQGDFNPANIQFTNVVNHEEVMEQLKQPVEQKTKDKITYHVYRIKGRFQADFLPNYFAYKQNVVGVSFRHRF
jgi:potassium efflux system protein